jgi:hypothetical protein
MTMARRKNPELERLQAFCLNVIDFEAERSGRTLGIFVRLRESIAHCTRVNGIRMAAADLVEMFQDLKDPELSALDARLRSAELPTLSSMRNREDRRLAHVLLRGKIRNDAEFYLVSARLSDMADATWTETERSTANRLVAEYEEGASRGRAT